MQQSSGAQEAVDEDTLCVVCMETERNTVMVPCGHLVLCEGCSKGITVCPMCRDEVVEFIPLLV